MKLHAFFVYGLGLFIAFISSAILVASGMGTMAWAKQVPVRSVIAPLPQHLRDTGLFVAGSTTEVQAQNLAFSPQYPLWSDGAAKRRWFYLPPGTSIDASKPDAWDFPAGTRLWKEFSFEGRRVETRLIERLADRSWRYSVYVWNEEGTDAVLAPKSGISALPVSVAPNGRYAVPSESDCRACHEGAAVPPLGLSVLQLSPDRDPLAVHADPVSLATNNLSSLAARGLIRKLPKDLLTNPPRIAASSPEERAALGYLHGNCGQCHNNNESEAGAAVPVGLLLAQKVGRSEPGSASSEQVLHTLINGPSRYRPPGTQGDAKVIVPGRSDLSVLVLRMKSRNPQMQMPPLGTEIPDAEGIALIERWINKL